MIHPLDMHHAEFMALRPQRHIDTDDVNYLFDYPAGARTGSVKPGSTRACSPPRYHAPHSAPVLSMVERVKKELKEHREMDGKLVGSSRGGDGKIMEQLRAQTKSDTLDRIRASRANARNDEHVGEWARRKGFTVAAKIVDQQERQPNPNYN